MCNTNKQYKNLLFLPHSTFAQELIKIKINFKCLAARLICFNGPHKKTKQQQILHNFPVVFVNDLKALFGH